jgi:hypothetical protein
VTWGATYWPAFLIGTFLAFIGPETYALITNWHNTLSYWSWQDEPGIYSWEWDLSLVLWLVFAVWITGHIWWQVWR